MNSTPLFETESATKMVKMVETTLETIKHKTNEFVQPLQELQMTMNRVVTQHWAVMNRLSTLLEERMVLNQRKSGTFEDSEIFTFADRASADSIGSPYLTDFPLINLPFEGCQSEVAVSSADAGDTASHDVIPSLTARKPFGDEYPFTQTSPDFARLLSANISADVDTSANTGNRGVAPVDTPVISLIDRLRNLQSDPSWDFRGTYPADQPIDDSTQPREVLYHSPDKSSYTGGNTLAYSPDSTTDKELNASLTADLAAIRSGQQSLEVHIKELTRLAEKNKEYLKEALIRGSEDIVARIE